MEEEEKPKLIGHLGSADFNRTAVGGVFENVSSVEKAEHPHEKRAEDLLPMSNRPGTSVAEELQVTGEATPGRSHAGGNHVLKETSVLANEGDNPHDESLLPVNSQERYCHQPMEWEAGPDMRYDSFVKEAMGCLNELRKVENELEFVQETSGSNEDYERGTKLSDSTLPVLVESGLNQHFEYLEPIFFETIPSDEHISGLVEFNNEICSESGVQINALDANPNQFSHKFGNGDDELRVPRYERSVLNRPEGAPVGRNNRNYAWNMQGGILNTGLRRSMPAVYDSYVELPTPANLRAHRWYVSSQHEFKLGSSGFCYVGGIAHGRMHGFGRLALEDGKEFLEGVWRINRLVELRHCQLICSPGNQTVLIVKRQNDHLLTIYENHYVARVTFNAIEELDFADSIAHVRSAFFNKLTVLQEVADELEHKRQVSLDKFVALLSDAIGVNADSKARANILFLLSLYLGKPDADLPHIILNRNFPVDVRDAGDDLLRCENNYLKSRLIFSNKAAKLRLDLWKALQKVYIDGTALYKKMLIDKCPKAFPGLLSFIQDLPPSKMVYVTCEDLNVFDHLASQPCFEHYKTYFTDLLERYRLTIHNIKTCTVPSTVVPIMSPVYGFLVKSFWDTILEIIQIANSYECKDMLKFDSGNWKLVERIIWPVDESIDAGEQEVVKFFSSSGIKSSLFHKGLDVQYKVIFEMLIHFSPENYVKKKEYPYDFRVLEQDLSWWQKSLKMVGKKKVGLVKRLQNMTTERIVWLCLLDRTIHEVFKDEPQSQALLKPYNSLLQGHISMIEKSSADSHERFRLTTQGILKFITTSASYFREAQEEPGVDVEILVQQMWNLSTPSTKIPNSDPTAFPNIRGLVEECNRYLKLRQFLNTDAPSGHFSANISHIMQALMNIVASSLKKSVPTTALLRYLRSLNDFLDDFKNIDFLEMYFVKSEFFDPAVLEKVDNNLTGGNCSYRVINIEKFLEAAQVLRNQAVPRHHIVQVVSQLLECIAACLDKHWQSDGVELEVCQLECTGLLLDAVRKSFMYLKEQPDYVDFDLFEKESVGPFLRVVRDCETLNDLKIRIGKVSESFWYIRKMDEISIDQALKMFKDVNTCNESGVLFDCYNLYLRHYDENVAKYMTVLSEGKSHAEGLDEVVQTVSKTRLIHFSMWTEEFKTKEIPVLLAGLCAVWSFLMSEDVSSTGKFLKPHCIQILCILRLLSVDLSEGADNHLAQVLTGQGKSVILGLLSGVLALTGHKVKVLCYSEYLSARDQNDFDEFFQIFQLDEKILYCTFDDMANSFTNPVSNGIKTSLRQLVEDRVMNHDTSWPSVTRVTSVSKNTVLLVDEVDVFFTDQFYGNTYCPGTRLGFSGLAKLQEFIWEKVLSSQRDSRTHILNLSKKYVDDEVAAGNKAMLEFRDFLNKPGTFPLLDYDGEGNVCVNSHTNRSLFDKHLLKMVDHALGVRHQSWRSCEHKITDRGTISRKREDGIYDNSYVGYVTLFNYFKLKKSNYDSKNFENYGYLALHAGEISYALLPSQFQLILGVSGTLTDLGEYENTGIRSYGIHNFSFLPSFFGESNLEFSKDHDFHYFDSEQDWLKKIYDGANAIVESHRAVLVFFDSDVKMSTFSKEYKTKFDRLNEMTENTSGSERDAYIEEAGLPCTVTLATKGMGRGVDYKSSLTVEKSGGVHVIQTFFSADMKEEVQIKGRTARKDNKGSYELMVCRRHLVDSKIIHSDDRRIHNYSSLDAIRKQLSDDKGKTVNEMVAMSERNHSVTMKYFGLI